MTANDFMAHIRRINNPSAGFIDDVSDVIAVEAWKNPHLLPDLSRDKTIFIFSDYSRVHGRYKTYSFLIIGRSGADYFNARRKAVRLEFDLKNRRISYKALNDRKKMNALPKFLNYAADMNGLLITFAVDTHIRYMFAEQFLEVWPELSAINKVTLEDMLRVVHFGGLAVITSFSSGQNIVWFTDSDAIVANETHEALFGKLAQGTIKQFMPEESVGRIGFGLSSVDDGSLEIEDFIAIPDLAAGALCETLDQLRNANLRVTSRVALNKPHVKSKTDMICGWMSDTSRQLRRCGVVFDKLGHGQWDFRPTFFGIMNPDVSARYPISMQLTSPSDPIRFDIEEVAFE